MNYDYQVVLTRKHSDLFMMGDLNLILVEKPRVNKEGTQSQLLHSELFYTRDRSWLIDGSSQELDKKLFTVTRKLLASTCWTMNMNRLNSAHNNDSPSKVFLNIHFKFIIIPQFKGPDLEIYDNQHLFYSMFK